MIVQSNTETGLTNITFSCPEDELDMAKKAISKAKEKNLSLMNANRKQEFS